MAICGSTVCWCDGGGVGCGWGAGKGVARGRPIARQLAVGCGDLALGCGQGAAGSLATARARARGPLRSRGVRAAAMQGGMHADAAAAAMHTRPAGARGRLLKEQLAVRPRRDAPWADAVELVPIESSLPYEKGLYVVVRAVQLLREHMSGLLVVCVGGPSGSGKTSFCKRLLELLAGSTQLSLSNYIDVDMAELAGGNIDDPRATDFSLLLRNLSELRAGRDTLAPVYDFKQRARNGWTKVSPPANGVLIVEGVYALNAVVRTMSDLCVSISGGVHFDLVKRIKRDCMLSAGGTVSDDDEAAAAAAAAAGGDGGQLLQNISETVFPFFKAFVEPDLQLAHVRVTNAHNPFSGFLDQAQYSLKSDKAVSTQDIEAYMEGYAQRKRHVNKRLSSVGSVTEVEAAGTLDMDGEIATSPSSASEEQQREQGSLSAEEPAAFTVKDEETTDIYLLPPGMEAETCRDWIRMRLREGHYSVHFEEYVSDGNMIISPGMSFEVNVRVLSGLMTLGYTVGAILKRESEVYESTEGDLLIKVDHVDKLNRTYVSINSCERAEVEMAGTALGLDGTYMPRSYIEQVQLMDLFEDVSGDLGKLESTFAAPGSQDSQGHGPFMPTSPPGSPWNSPLKQLAKKLSPMPLEKKLGSSPGSAGGSSAGLRRAGSFTGASGGIGARDATAAAAAAVGAPDGTGSVDTPTGRTPTTRRSLSIELERSAPNQGEAVPVATPAGGASTQFVPLPPEARAAAAPPPATPGLALPTGDASAHRSRSMANGSAPSAGAVSGLRAAMNKLNEVATLQRDMAGDMEELAHAVSAIETRAQAEEPQRASGVAGQIGAAVAAAAIAVAAVATQR